MLRTYLNFKVSFCTLNWSWTLIWRRRSALARSSDSPQGFGWVSCQACGISQEFWHSPFSSRSISPPFSAGPPPPREHYREHRRHICSGIRTLQEALVVFLLWLFDLLGWKYHNCWPCQGTSIDNLWHKPKIEVAICKLLPLLNRFACS